MANYNSPEHHAWTSLKQRCLNPKNPRYHNYGGRGIKVCERWKRSFLDFLADMGSRPTPDHSIERKNNDGDYCPENCVWATIDVQSKNKRTNRMIEFRGETKTMMEWAKELGFRFALLRNRIVVYGWPVEIALTEPVKKCRKIGSKANALPSRVMPVVKHD